MRRYWVFVLMSLLFLSGCAPKISAPSKTKEQKLTRLIVSIDKSIDTKEAKLLSKEAISYTATLAKKYKVDTTPWFHNFLVNTGFKDRGLCYQWADDLYLHLSRLHLKSIRILPIGANIGDYWTEHNAIVVLPRYAKVPLAQGVILDGWRNSGDLYFAPVSQDPKYRWSLRLERVPNRVADTSR